jgi:hypothetical protein
MPAGLFPSLCKLHGLPHRPRPVLGRALGPLVTPHAIRHRPRVRSTVWRELSDPATGKPYFWQALGPYIHYAVKGFTSRCLMLPQCRNTTTQETTWDRPHDLQPCTG